MSDVKDILGLQKEGAPKLGDIISPTKKFVPKKKLKKPAGVKREVFNLIESQQLQNGVTELDVASLMPTMLTPPPSGLKEKRKLITKVRPWLQKPFRNSARKDGLTLHRWALAEEDQDDYFYARYDRKVTVLDYTNEQYTKYFNNDPNWTREDTDTLWNLCKEFDLRFVVVADRFPNTSKSMEDLKERYYSISKKLVQIASDEDEDLAKHPLLKFTYNKQHDVERKQQYERLYSRTSEQVEEEKKLIMEYKRIESSLKKHQKEKKTPKQVQAEVVDSSKITRKEKSSGSFTRSSTVLTPVVQSNKTGKRVDEVLIEMGIGLRPIVPTANVCKLYNELRADIATFLDLEKVITDKEYQLQILREKQPGKRGIPKIQTRIRTPKPTKPESDGLTDDLPLFSDPFADELDTGSPTFASPPIKRVNSVDKSAERKKRRKKDI